MRRLALGLVALLVVAAPAGADIVDRKQSVDSRITALQDRVAAAQEKEAALRQEIDDVSGRIRGLEQQVGDGSAGGLPGQPLLEVKSTG
jgi:septal ring factor EnvC (AmiA/AmiB activator)